VVAVQALLILGIISTSALDLRTFDAREQKGPTKSAGDRVSSAIVCGDALSCQQHFGTVGRHVGPSVA